MFQDIGDLEYAKEQLREAFELPLKEPELMEKLKVRPVKGVLLYGPPGNGKTLLAKAAATEFSANFFVISGADLSRGNPAHAAARIKELFNIARDNVPSIIFIDELDQIAPNRSSIASEIFVPVTNQLLDELDGIRELKGVMVLASTNRPDSVDPALLRANRLEKHIEIPFPDEAARLKIMEVCLKGVAVSDGVSLDKYAKATDGFSGADIQEFVNEAKKSVLRRKIKGDQAAEAITESDFEEGLKAKKGKGSQINQNS
jgi:transitional endoplasmic reticulum ATPase